MSSEAQRPSPSTAHKQWQAPGVEELQSHLPQYEVLELLGRGGMGAVYKARQKSLKRLVAIKILPLAASDDELNFAERFKNEAYAMAQLNHPGIVNVHDAGQTEAGLLYFVMEHVEGRDLAHEIAACVRLPQAEVKAIGMQVCEALSYLHGHGIIHRDIKPANILLTALGRVKVADFGLAKLAEPQVSALLTHTGTSMGTLDFMAPECRRAGVLVDQRADLFSLGVMIYQMLTGELPHGMFKLPSQMLPEIDERFDDIICRALEPKPEERYQSAKEMRDDLAAIGVAVPHVEKMTAPPEKRSARSWLIIGGGAALLVLMVWVVFLMNGHSTPTSGAPPLITPIEALFDGHTFSGWKTISGAAPESNWRMEAGVLTSSTRTTMRTVAEFGDCELDFEWRVGAGGNGGVFYHVLGDPLAAPELQVCDPANAGRTPSGGLFGVVQPLSDASKPLGEWNTGRLVVRGSLREHWINGQKVCAYDAASADFRAKLAASTFAGKPQFGVGSRGALALQNNGGEVAYRNLRIQRLNEKPVSGSMHEAPTLQWQRVDLSSIKGLKPDGGRYRCPSYVLLEDVIGHPVKNIAVKVTAAPAPGNFPLHIMLRTAQGGKRYQGVIQTKTIHGGIGYWEASRAIPEELQGSTASPVPVDGQTRHEFEFRAIEENLTLLQDGIVVATATDARLKKGGIAVQIGEGGVLSSIEYAILDGLSDEAQRGKVNGKPVAKAVREETWIDWLGPKLAAGEFQSGGYTRDGDGVTTDLFMKGVGIIPEGVGDAAVRVTGLLRGAGIQITARDRNANPGRELYVAHDTGVSLYIGRMMRDNTVVNLVEEKYPAGITPGGEHALEFRCVGSTLTATLNGNFTITTQDSALTQGPWAVVLKRGALMKKVEVQVLSRE